MKHFKSPPGKRIEGLTAEMPAAEAAARVFRTRLEAVEQMLPLALDRAGESPEFVHQLRVSTRRADAALRTLGSCLEGSVSRRTRRRLRDIRRAAGAARECDVHVEAFRDRREDEPDEAMRALLDDLVLWSRGQRREAQRDIVEVAARFPAKKLGKARRTLLDSVREPGDVRSAAGGAVTLADVARVTLPPLVEAVRKAAAADMHVLDNLHELRIRGKRLRYALEIFQPCFDGGLDDAYRGITDLQRELGAINDVHEILLCRLEAFAHGVADEIESGERDALDALHGDYEARLDAARRQAVEDWERGAWSAALDALETAVAGRPAASARDAPS